MTNSTQNKTTLEQLKEERTELLKLVEPRLKKIWDNPKENEFWARYK